MSEILKKVNYERIWFCVKLVFLFLTPTMFRWLNFAFIFHSFFLTTVTMVVIVWTVGILLSFVFGRIACGWLCPFGTVFDLVSRYSFFRDKKKHPRWWLRYLNLWLFFSAALAAALIRFKIGAHHGIAVNPFLLPITFDLHDKVVWIADSVGIVLIGLVLGSRFWCRNMCFVGTLCALASKFQRFVAVVDTTKCTKCESCEKHCPAGIPIMDYIQNEKGRITDTECMKCGICIDRCLPRAIGYKMVWKR